MPNYPYDSIYVPDLTTKSRPTPPTQPPADYLYPSDPATMRRNMGPISVNASSTTDVSALPFQAQIVRHGRFAFAKAKPTARTPLRLHADDEAGAGTAKCWSVVDMKKGGISKDIVLEMPPLFTCCGGGVLLSHTLPGAVPLPCWVLASGFGMGPGVSPRP